MTAELDHDLTIRVGLADETSYTAAVNALVDDRVASAIASGNATLWGPAAEAESGKRLAWTHLSQTSREVADEVAALAAELSAKGLDHIVLAGMGGSSLAPEVIAEAADVPLVV
ncbi:MAG TPA: glucose-6-phosphate isomerase, partial [Nocardioides sp.]|nr:glucose-6-phosphate isomerase [Nocardioides sp.]